MSKNFESCHKINWNRTKRAQNREKKTRCAKIEKKRKVTQMLYFYSIWICAALRVFLWWDFNEICLSGGAIEWLGKTKKKKKTIAIWCLPAKWCSGSRLVVMGFCVTGTILMGSLLGPIRCTCQAIVLTSASRLLPRSSQPDGIKTGQKCESSGLEIRTESGCTQL